MLDTSIISPSHTSFASPVLLVKKDDEWQFCINYRELNAISAKEKFLILVIDYLLDELNGAAIMSNIDLRFRYHQIRVKTKDVQQTAFLTHQGHDELKIMPLS